MLDIPIGDDYHRAMSLVVIPARIGSTRLANKPLVDIGGHPMIEHVYRRALEAAGVEKVIVATDHEDIAAAVRKFGGEVMMTGECRTGTDRVAQVASQLADFDIIVNIQGDEPLLPPEMIEEVTAPLTKDPELGMATLKRLFLDNEEPTVPSMVKVVTDLNGNALYFSRSILPYPRNTPELGPFLHVGIYAFRRDTLLRFASLPATPLERAEGLEQLRALEHGIRVHVPTTTHFSIGVDTPQDLEKVRNIFKTRNNLASKQ
jgi:3-deoxy-manno-octulosonate cytidylyltransferase (CMP-KDO synthetase)